MIAIEVTPMVLIINIKQTFSWKSMADFFWTTTSVGGNKNLVNGVGI